TYLNGINPLRSPPAWVRTHDHPHGIPLPISFANKVFLMSGFVLAYFPSHPGDEQLGEYWSARELYRILGYTEWRNFRNVVIKRAMKACEENGRAVADHFVQSYKMVTLGSASQRKTEDVLLSRYAAYLVVMNGDPNMPVVAMG